MTSRDFAYWLQGFFELAEPKEGLTDDQAKCIQKHLAMVFVHEIDPSMGDDEHQKVLNKIHNDVKQHYSDYYSDGNKQEVKQKSTQVREWSCHGRYPIGS